MGKRTPRDRNDSTYYYDVLVESCVIRIAYRKKAWHREAIIYSTFAPFVLSSSGGMGPCAVTVSKRLGSLPAEKHNVSYSSMMGCRLSFALFIRSSI